MPTKIADPPPGEVLEDVWGIDENNKPVRIRRKPRPTVWGLTADGKPDPQEDDEPVESIFALLQCDILIDCLCSSWSPPDGKPYLIVGNVGLFFEPTVPPVVPDTMLSLDIPQIQKLGSDDSPRSYIVWDMGKLPEVVFEFVSKTTNDEDGIKLEKYERIGIPYYVLYDPARYLGEEILRVYHLVNGRYEVAESNFLPDIGLGVTVWQGPYKNQIGMWLRWRDAKGKLLESADESRAVERKRADAAEERAKAMAAKLKELGIEM